MQFRDGLSVLEEAWRLAACMPPAVPLPKPGPCKGFKRGSRNGAGSGGARPAARRRRGGAGTGRDLSGELNMRAIARLPHRDDTDADQRLAHVARLQGFDATPQVVSRRKLEQAIADGGRQLWRGVVPGPQRSARQINQQFTDGPARFGQGIYGNGVYFSDRVDVARRYADFSPDPDSLLRIVLPADARTISYPDLIRQMGSDPTTVDFDHARLQARLLRDLARADGDIEDMRKAWESYQGTSLNTIAQSDPGVWAASRGFDAIIVPGQGSRGEEVVLLNRGAAMTARAAVTRAAS